MLAYVRKDSIDPGLGLDVDPDAVQGDGEQEDVVDDDQTDESPGNVASRLHPTISNRS